MPEVIGLDIVRKDKKPDVIGLDIVRRQKAEPAGAPEEMPPFRARTIPEEKSALRGIPKGIPTGLEGLLGMPPASVVSAAADVGGKAIVGLEKGIEEAGERAFPGAFEEPITGRPRRFIGGLAAMPVEYASGLAKAALGPPEAPPEGEKPGITALKALPLRAANVVRAALPGSSQMLQDIATGEIAKRAPEEILQEAAGVAMDVPILVGIRAGLKPKPKTIARSFGELAQVRERIPVREESPLDAIRIGEKPKEPLPPPPVFPREPKGTMSIFRERTPEELMGIKSKPAEPPKPELGEPIPAEQMFEAGGFAVSQNGKVVPAKAVRPIVEPPTKTPETGGIVKREIRWDKYELRPESIDRLEGILEDLGLDTRKVRTQKDIEAAARELGAKPEELLGIQKITDVTANALRNDINSLAKRSHDLDQQIVDAHFKGDRVLEEKLRTEAEQIDLNIKDNFRKLLPATTEAARLVAQYRMRAMGDLTPDVWYRQAIKALGDQELFTEKVRKDIDKFLKPKRQPKIFTEQRYHAAMERIKQRAATQLSAGVDPSILRDWVDIGGYYAEKGIIEFTDWSTRVIADVGEAIRPHLRDVYRNAITAAKGEDIRDLSIYMAGLNRADWSVKLMTARKAGLFTVMSHIKNIFGNTTLRVLETAKDPIATLLDVAVKGYTGNRSKSFGLGNIQAGLAGLKETPKKIFDYMNTGVDEGKTMQKLDLHKEINFDNTWLDRYVKFSFRTLGAEDIAARMNITRGSLYEQAKVQALNEGLKGEKFNARVKELFKNPTDEMVQIAQDDATYGTFQAENFLAQKVGAAKAGLGERAKTAETLAKRSAARAGYMAADLVAPFTKTPTNIAKVIFVDYSPVGGFKALLELPKIKESQIAQKNLVEGLARSITGTGLTALGALLASKDLMTGSWPDDPSERRRWEEEGRTPFSVLIDGKWRRVDILTVLGNMLALGADYVDLVKKGKGKAEAVVGAAGKAAKSFTEFTFLKGIGGALDVLREPEEKAPKFIAQQVASFVPGTIAQVARISDKGIKRMESPTDALKLRIPGLREQVPTKRTVFGRKMEIESGAVGQLFDPFQPSTFRKDPVIDELRRLDISMGFPSRKIGDKELTEEEYGEFLESAGTQIKEMLRSIIESSGYKEIPDEAKTDMLEAAIRSIRSTEKKKVAAKVLR